MKNLITKFLAIFIVVISLSSCDGDKLGDELLGNNEYLIELDDKVYEEGKSMFAGIASDLSDNNTMVAGVSTTLSISFESSNYNKGEVLVVGMDEDPNVTAVAVGFLIVNSGTANEEFITYFAHSGTATIVNKGKIEFDLTCYRISDINLDDSINQDAVPFIISGYVKENNPE